ncbi:MAG TPA: 2-C-methyl-D-erythritol 4-phosphate cytidylyltransferase [Bacteroidales bacterium]|nr:MAG: putative 2-C-methyl-D-erythritol 4-phosphate cytidylyltransferase 2 [Bacteroidetes bacterium ADurb.Bin217]HPM12119.1 2-C-methyl-D-erythritol 4-phosphate cytidylyltransferase [Bacteroidales bacterium]
MNLTSLYAIIVAGGKGMRMQNDIPKQFLILSGKPVLQHSLEAFYRYNNSIQCIVVLPKDQISYWQQLCVDYNCMVPHTIAEGGSERFFSVLHGLQYITSHGFVAIHDGVRPLVSNEIIAQGFAYAQQYLAAIPVIDSVDSLRYVEKNTTYVVNREPIKRVQTPQVFETKTLLHAYTLGYDLHCTDDAAVWEKAGNTVFCYKGDEKNIKITTPLDLCTAELLINM